MAMSDSNYDKLIDVAKDVRINWDFEQSLHKMASQSNPRQSNARKGLPATKSRGALIMKTVSILLVSSRRICNQRSKETTAKNGKSGKNRHRPNKMDDSIGKPTPKTLENLKRKTHFSKKELTTLCKIYRKLVLNCYNPNGKGKSTGMNTVISRPYAAAEGIDRNVFRELLHSTFDISAEETLMERIFTSWEKGSDGLPLRLESWICGISVFLRGTLFEKANFCFRVYDLNTDGFITKDEMFALMKNCLIKQPQDEDPDESVKDLMEIALRKFDVDKDGKISFQDYLTTVSAEPLLLEAFGQCLPSETATISFLTAFQN